MRERLGIIANAARIAASGPSLLPLSTPILFEGDSNTSWVYKTDGWAKRVLTKTGGRYYLPAGGDFANAGATVTGASNSLMARQSAVLAKAAEQKAISGHCIVVCQIGTNGGTLATDLVNLAAYIADFRAAGIPLYFNTCPAFGVSGGYIGGLNAWLMTPGNVDGYVDVNTSITGADTSDGTHYNESGKEIAGTLMASYLSALIVSSDIYTDAGFSNFVTGTMAGTGGTPGANASGSLADGWTCSRLSGDGSATLSKVTLGGKTAQRLSVTAGASNTYFRLARSDAATLLTGDVVDGWGTVQIVSATDSASILHAGISIAGGTFPAASGAALDPTNWAGPYPWRVYPISQASGSGSVASQINLQVAAGKTVVIDVADMRGGVRESSSAVLPANTVAPVMSSLAEGGSLACTDGTWTGTPTPTLISKQFYIGSTPVASSYVPTSGDVGQTASCFVTYGNIAGNTSAASNSVTITAAPANWWSPTSDDSIDLDFAGDRYRYNGTSYASVAALLSASGSTFSRALAAYYVDTDGAMTSFSTNTLRRGGRGMLYEAAATNLAVRSEDIAYYTNSGTTDTANDFTAPDGGATADTIAETATTATHNVNSSVTVVSGTAYVLSIFFAPGTDSVVQIVPAGSGLTSAYCNFDLAAGTAGTPGGTGIAAAGVEILADGWVRCWVRVTLTGTTLTYYWALINNNPSGARLASYAGDTAATLHVWGRQCEASSSGPSSYVPALIGSTVTRPADALSIVLPTGTHDLTVTFDDDSTQALTGLSGTYALPTTLNRPYIKRITGDRTA